MIVACVRTGTKFPAGDVYRLRAAISRWLHRPHEFWCITDRPEDLPGISTAPARGLPGWFAKMALFDFDWRDGEPVLYFDLDTVIVGDLAPLWRIRDHQFAICANFTRAAGNTEWPCRYGSCCMVIDRGFGAAVWEPFWAAPDAWMRRAGRYGDQWIIEQLAPGATLLQHVLPPGFFLGYRDLTEQRPSGVSVVVFAGGRQPEQSVSWVRAAIF